MLTTRALKGCSKAGNLIRGHFMHSNGTAGGGSDALASELMRKRQDELDRMCKEGY